MVKVFFRTKSAAPKKFSERFLKIASEGSSKPHTNKLTASHEKISLLQQGYFVHTVKYQSVPFLQNT
jgi:hypothetical protein